MSMGVLMEYLTHSSVSPLPSVFVEVEDPLASNVSNFLVQSDFDYNTSLYNFAYITLYLEHNPTQLCKTSYS